MKSYAKRCLEIGESFSWAYFTSHKIKAFFNMWLMTPSFSQCTRRRQLETKLYDKKVSLPPI